MNNYHPSIKLTLDEKPSYFLDTVVSNEGGDIKTIVHVKENKRCKRNAIKGELHRASKISSNFNAEVDRFKRKFVDVGYPIKLIESVIRDFNTPPIPESDLIIPTWLCDDRKFIQIKVPYYPKNEELSKSFINKLVKFTNNKVKSIITWSTRKVRSLFPLNDRVNHLPCVIYQGICSCGETYVGEIERIAEGRFSEHNTLPKLPSLPNILKAIQVINLNG